MATLLRIDSGIDPRTSVSRRLTGAFAQAWDEAGGDVVVRDLHVEQIPHLPYAGLHFVSRHGVPTDSPAGELQDRIIEEVLAADALVVGAPLYNYSVPSTLKAWLDYLHVPGRTAARPAESGALAGKPVVVMSSRGAAYDSGDLEARLDHAVPVFHALMGTAMGMEVEAITVDRTLADLLPELDPERAAVLLADALESAAARGGALARSFLAGEAERGRAGQG